MAPPGLFRGTAAGRVCALSVLCALRVPGASKTGKWGVLSDIRWLECSRLRKRSNRERRPYPQRLKPDIITITYGRPEGRPLQRSPVLSSLRGFGERSRRGGTP